jgi:hypothetical protein
MIRSDFPKPQSRSLRWFDAIVLVFIALLGAIHLPYPLGDDQALFTLGAQKMSQGAVLYKDFYDVKQPGIFFFYLTAGRLFGFHEIGSHALDALYILLFSVVLIFTLKRYFTREYLPALTALLYSGFYYAAPGREHSTQFFGQVEGLAGLPLFLAAWCAWVAVRAQANRHASRVFGGMFCSGVAGGIALVLKLMFLPILVSLWLFTIAWMLRNRLGPIRALLSVCCASLLAGLLVAPTATALYFARTGDLWPLIYTSFVFPLTAAREAAPGSRTGQLIVGLQWFLTWASPLLALALIGGWVATRRSYSFLGIAMVLWMMTGFVVIFLQFLSWWPYHYLLLLTPMSVLAANGIDIIFQYLRGQPEISEKSGPAHGVRLAAVGSLALLFSPVGTCWAIDGLFLAHHRFALTKADRTSFQGKIDPNYAKSVRECEFLSETDSLPGDIFVAGHYIYYTISGRNQAIAMNGESADELLPGAWKEIHQQLAVKLPPYIFIAADASTMPAMTNSGLPELLEAKYKALRHSDAGTWYQIKP